MSSHYRENKPKCKRMRVYESDCRNRDYVQYVKVEIKLDILCGRQHERGRGWKSMRTDFKKSLISLWFAYEDQAAVWGCCTLKQHAAISRSSLSPYVPVRWEQSSRQACPSGRRSDGTSACHFRWTWSPGSHRGGAGFAAAPCLRSETG